MAARERSADRQRVGKFTRVAAATRACYLVARVSGVPAGAVEAVDVKVYVSRAAKRWLIPSGDEWDVLCFNPR